MIISTKCIVSEVIDNGRIANNIALAVLRVRIEFGANDISHAAICIIASTPFFTNNTTLCIYLLRQQKQTACPVVHYQQRRVNNSLANGRHVGETINSLVDGRVSIDITAKVHTDRLKIINNSFARKVLSSIERHMLQEVSQTVLVILFQHRAYCLSDMEIAALFRLFIMTDIVRQSVL